MCAIASRITAEAQPLLEEKTETFTSAIKNSSGHWRPQAIAHRGYKTAFPENTMGAFRGATEVGAHAIETDIHLSKDGVVVISHDATLERCFGKKDKIIDCTWDYLKTARTLKEPSQPMPRLKDLLEYLASPGLEHIWVILDIKLDNDADTVMKSIAATLQEVQPSRPWNERILLGIWTTDYLPICQNYLPDFQMVHIGFNIVYARKFLKTPGVNFSMLQKIMVGPLGKRFLRDLKNSGRSIFLWTVNEENWMKWSIEKGVDGVITDDPKKYLTVCKEYTEGSKQVHISLLDGGMIILINILSIVFGWIIRFRKYGPKVDQKAIGKALELSLEDSPSSSLTPGPRVRRVPASEQ